MPGSRKVQFAWKRRPSEIRGYERALYTTLDNGDYIRVDYNTGDKRARLYVEVHEESGSAYYSIISHGRITLERNNAGRSTGVAGVLKDRASEFATIPNNDVVELIANNYGIRIDDTGSDSEKDEQRKQELAETRLKYFRKGELASDYDSDSQYIPVSRFAFIDLFDLGTGLALGGVFFLLNQYSFLAFGAVLAFWGILTGFFDILIRKREPLFTKIIFFLGSGIFLYIYGYFYI
ncbi:MAG: hypothetical protein WDA74_00790 [Spirochaetota bacterium]